MNDLNRLESIGKDAFEDEYEDLEKFIEVIEAIKQKYGIHYHIDSASFDDIIEEDEDEVNYFDEEEISESEEEEN